MCHTEKYINPFTDYGFKKIFGDTENTELLRSLINDILGLEGQDQIETIIFKNGELLPDSPKIEKRYLICTVPMRKEVSLLLNSKRYTKSIFKAEPYTTPPFPYKNKQFEEHGTLA